jgi:hypothetical protein
MSTGAFTLVTSAKQYIGDGTIDLDTDSFKAALYTSASNISVNSTIIGGVTNEVAQTNGYITGGVALFLPDYTLAVWKTGSATWIASTGTIVAKWMAIYKDGTANGIVSPIVGFLTLDSGGADFTIADGVTQSFACDPVNGWFKAP